jgi:hypothetical protein
MSISGRNIAVASQSQSSFAAPGQNPALRTDSVPQYKAFNSLKKKGLSANPRTVLTQYTGKLKTLEFRNTMKTKDRFQGSHLSPARADRTGLNRKLTKSRVSP